MEETMLSELEHKEYLLKIAEDKVVELEKSIKKHESFVLISIPLAIVGLIFILNWIEHNFSFFIFMVLSTIVFLVIIFLLGLLIGKFKK